MSDARPPKKDLVVLVADRSMEHALRALLVRQRSLGIRRLDFEVIRDTIGADPGCYRRSHELLRPLVREFEHALVIFDHHGSGQECRGVEEVEREVGDRLSQNGWDNRAVAIIIQPELEAWIWGPSRQVDQTLGWRDRPIALRRWLAEQGLWPEDKSKPPDPKEAFRKTLRELGIPPSSATYADLAQNVSLRKCQDRSFHRLAQILRSWFPSR